MDSELSGALLVSAPAMDDPNFSRAVVLLIHHDKEEGTMGLVLNRLVTLSIDDVWSHVSNQPVNCSRKARWGGPVEGSVVCVHQDPDLADTSVIPGIHVSAGKESVRQALTKHSADRAMLMIGHAGWSAGQLEKEINLGGWLVLPATQGLVFRNWEDLWEICCSEVGDNVLGLPDRSRIIHPESN